MAALTHWFNQILSSSAIQLLFGKIWGQFMMNICIGTAVSTTFALHFSQDSLFNNMKFATKAIHAGIEPDPGTGAVMTPIFQTSTYVQSAPGRHKGYEYARTQNPTRSALEKNLAALENGTDAVSFGSGLAAQDAVIKLLKIGRAHV